jgi:hypothetical protein
MAKYLSNEQQFTGATPPTPPGDEALGGRKRVYRATVNLDAPKLSPSQSGTSVTIADTVSLCRVPAGMRFIEGRITSSVSLGTSTVAIGNAVSPGKYRAAAVFTAVDTPTLFGTAVAMAAAAATAEEEVLLTVATANLPTTAGAKLVIDLEFAGP